MCKKNSIFYPSTLLPHTHTYTAAPAGIRLYVIKVHKLVYLYTNLLQSYEKNLDYTRFLQKIIV